MSSLLDWLVQNEPSFRKTRLPSLYSDLSVLKNSNPEGYAANVTAWQAALARAALAGQLPTEQKLIIKTSNELLDALASPQYGRPTGLGVVVDECVRSGKMLDIRDFQTSEKSIYSRGWIPSPWAVLRWGLRQAGLVSSGSYDVAGQLRSGNLVLVQALEEVSRQVLSASAKRGQSITDRTMTKEAFAEGVAKVSGSPLSSQELDVLLRYLHRDKAVLSYDSKTIKMKGPNSAQPEPISSEDATIAALKTLLDSLTSQVSTLETKVSVLLSSAQAAVKAGNKHAALSALRSKKLAEKSLQQRRETFYQLEEVYTKIEQAVDQLQIVEVMQASAGVLKDLNQRVGGVERVETLMDGMREEIGKIDEVGQVLQEPLDGNADVNEAEVDDEFEAMEREERRLKEDKEAEATRQRLQELERGEQQKQQHVVVDADLEPSVEQLQRMSIDAPTMDQVGA